MFPVSVVFSHKQTPITDVETPDSSEVFLMILSMTLMKGSSPNIWLSESLRADWRRLRSPVVQNVETDSWLMMESSLSQSGWGDVPLWRLKRGEDRHTWFWFCPWLAADLILTGCQSEDRLFVFFLIEGSFCKLVEGYLRLCRASLSLPTPGRASLSLISLGKLLCEDILLFHPPRRDIFVSVLFYLRFLFSTVVFCEASRETPRGRRGVNAAFVERWETLTPVWPVEVHTPSDLNLPKHRAARSDHFHLFRLSVCSISCWVYKWWGGNKAGFYCLVTADLWGGRGRDVETSTLCELRLPSCVLQAQRNSSDLCSCAESAARFSAIKENIIMFQPLYVQIRAGLL